MKKLFVIMAILIAFLISSQPVQATQTAASSAMLKNDFPEPDLRAEQLANFLDHYRSPLAPYATSFIKAADQYQLDWKLLPAITGVESTFGKNIPAGSYNAYGWNNGAYWFQSWEESIDHVSCYLKEKYVDRGLDNPYKIGPVYAPPSPAWAGKVVYFMDQIECFGQTDCLETLTLTI